MAEIVLQTLKLTKHYGSLTAVKDLSLDVYEGEVFGLLGPNGAGKTTSINMMCGLLKPDAGQVLVRGVPVANGNARVRARVGVCPQNIILWSSLTCIEQIQFVGEMYGMGGAAARRQGEALLNDLDLTEKRDKLARTLSGGMQRRLNLALALVHDPEIVVLDEPEAGLDPQSRVLVRDYVRSLARKRTVILTTHNMDEADRLADRVAIIDHGELLVLDSPDALKQRVGSGDVVEIRLAKLPDLGESVLRATTRVAPAGPVTEDQVRAALRDITSNVTYDAASNALHVRALHAVGVLPAILEALEHGGYQASEINIRANTLEDVFIQLTGRRLRE